MSESEMFVALAGGLITVACMVGLIMVFFGEDK